MKKIKFISVLAILFLSLSCVSNSNSRDDENGTSFLWKLESGESTVYLTGTIHIGSQDFYPLDDIYYDALDNSDYIVTEMELSQESFKRVSELSESLGMFTEGETLADHMDEEYIQKLSREILPLWGANFDAIKVFKPWALSSSLTVIGLQLAGYSPQFGLDVHFATKAMELEKNFLYFEEPEEQMAILSGGSMDEQIKQLYDSIDGYGELAEVGESFVTLYNEADFEAMSTMLLEEFEAPENKEYKQRLLVDRNYNWADSLEAQLEEGGNYMVVVGLAHLIGEESLVDILRDRGYRVVRQ